MRLPRTRAVTWSWVTWMMVVPVWRWSAASWPRSASFETGSSGASGSSSSSTLGWMASARASATFCISPPERPSMPRSRMPSMARSVASCAMRSDH